MQHVPLAYIQDIVKMLEDCMVPEWRHQRLTTRVFAPKEVGSMLIPAQGLPSGHRPVSVEVRTHKLTSVSGHPLPCNSSPFLSLWPPFSIGLIFSAHWVLGGKNSSLTAYFPVHINLTLSMPRWTRTLLLLRGVRLCRNIHNTDLGSPDLMPLW